jgi:outer membrane protein assembly factor BamB
LDNEIPSVDVADDGSLVTTVHRPLTDNWDGGDSVLVFNQKGDVLWKWEPVKTPGQPPEGIGASNVRVSHNNKYLGVGTVRGHFYLLDLVKRSIVWDVQLQGQIRYILFAKGDNEIYFGGDPYLYSYSLNGKFSWKSDIGGWPYSLALSDHYLFAGAKAGQYLSLLNKDTGKVIWRYPIDARPDNLLIAPDESYFIYQSSNGGLAMRNVLFDKSGVPILNMSTARNGKVTPDSNYLVYYSGQSVKLVNRRGSPLWSAELGPEKWPAPNGGAWISDDLKKIVVASAIDGNVYFFEGGIIKPSEKIQR